MPLERCAPGPSPNPGPLALPLPTACLPDCGPLEPASAVAPAPFTAACAALTPFRLLARAGSFCARRGAEDDPAHPLCRPKDRLTAPRRLSLHHTLSLPLSHHSHLPPRQLPPPQPHPPSSPCASRYPTPLTLGGTARAAVRRPSCVVVASLCILLSKRSLLFKIRVRSGLAVRSARSRPKNPGQGGSSVASGPTGVPMRRSIFTRNASCEGLLT